MSHFIKIRTQIRERVLLEQSLRELNYQFQSAEQGNAIEVRGYQESRERAEVVVNTGSAYDIGFQRRAAQYEVVADWWGVENNTDIRQDTFCREINRQYAYNVIREQVSEQDLVWESERVTENGDTVIVLSERG